MKVVTWICLVVYFGKCKCDQPYSFYVLQDDSWNPVRCIKDNTTSIVRSHHLELKQMREASPCTCLVQKTPGDDQWMSSDQILLRRFDRDQDDWQTVKTFTYSDWKVTGIFRLQMDVDTVTTYAGDIIETWNWANSTWKLLAPVHTLTCIGDASLPPMSMAITPDRSSTRGHMTTDELATISPSPSAMMDEAASDVSILHRTLIIGIASGLAAGLFFGVAISVIVCLSCKRIHKTVNPPAQSTSPPRENNANESTEYERHQNSDSQHAYLQIINPRHNYENVWPFNSTKSEQS